MRVVVVSLCSSGSSGDGHLLADLSRLNLHIVVHCYLLLLQLLVLSMLLYSMGTTGLVEHLALSDSVLLLGGFELLVEPQGAVRLRHVVFTAGKIIIMRVVAAQIHQIRLGTATTLVESTVGWPMIPVRCCILSDLLI